MSEVLKNLNIRKFATKQGYESATVGDNDLCVVLNDGEPALKTSTMPEASATELGNIYQYTGTTSGTFVHGYFYECVLNSSTYEWQQVNVQPAPVVTDQPNTRIYKRFDNVSRAMNTVVLYPVLRPTSSSVAYTAQYDGESIIHLRDYGGASDLVIGLTRKGGYDVEQRIYKATGVFTTVRAYLMADPQNPNTSKVIVLQRQNGSGFYGASTENNPIYAWYSFYGTNNSTSYDLGLDWVEPTKAVSEIPEYKPIQVESFDHMGTPNFLGHIVQYVGETDGGYTNGYFYRLDGSIEEEPAELYCNVTTGQEIEVTCTDPDGLISWLASQTGLTEKTVQSTLLDEEFEYTASATPTFNWAGETLDASQFDTYFSFSTQPATDDTVVWTTPSGYRRAVEYVNGSWTQVDVQPSSGGSSYTAGNGISIDANNEISVAAPTLQNIATSATELSICTYNNQRALNVCIGGANKTNWYGYSDNVEILGTTSNNGGVAIGMRSSAKNIAIAIGRYAVAGAHYSIQIGQGTNSEEGTMCVGLYNGSSFVNYKLLDNDGTIPAARHATLPTADGTYVLKLVITDGTPTLQWVAE